jgi:hypothetical protein
MSQRIFPLSTQPTEGEQFVNASSPPNRNPIATLLDAFGGVYRADPPAIRPRAKKDCAASPDWACTPKPSPTTGNMEDVRRGSDRGAGVDVVIAPRLTCASSATQEHRRDHRLGP